MTNALGFWRKSCADMLVRVVPHGRAPEAIALEAIALEDTIHVISQARLQASLEILERFVNKHH